MSKRKPRVVFDTNLLVSGLISPGGTPYLLLEAWRNKLFILITSQYLLQELKTVFVRPKFQKYNVSVKDTRIFIEKISKHVEKIPSSATVPLRIRDQKDEEVLLCAMYRHVDYLVTGDNDLLVLKDAKEIRPLKIVTVAEFLAVCSGKK